MTIKIPYLNEKKRSFLYMKAGKIYGFHENLTLKRPAPKPHKFNYGCKMLLNGLFEVPEVTIQILTCGKFSPNFQNLIQCHGSMCDYCWIKCKFDYILMCRINNNIPFKFKIFFSIWNRDYPECWQRHSSHIKLQSIRSFNWMPWDFLR